MLFIKKIFTPVSPKRVTELYPVHQQLTEGTKSNNVIGGMPITNRGLLQSKKRCFIRKLKNTIYNCPSRESNPEVNINTRTLDKRGSNNVHKFIKYNKIPQICSLKSKFISTYLFKETVNVYISITLYETTKFMISLLLCK